MDENDLSTVETLMNEWLLAVNNEGLEVEEEEGHIKQCINKENAIS